jgi:hypothetical protein
MNCTACGTANEPSGEFCAGCDKPLSAPGKHASLSLEDGKVH